MEKEKLTKRQIQARKTRDNIYRISVDLIEKKGFQNITVEEICKSAGVSVGSFYNSFKSKNEILDMIFEVADDYFLNVVAINIKDGSTKDKIVEFFKYYADYNVDRGLDFVKQLYTVKNNLFAAKGRHMQEVLKKIIEEGQSKGDISSDMTPEEIVIFLFIAIRGVVYDWCLHDGQYNLTETVINYSSRLVRSL